MTKSLLPLLLIIQFALVCPLGGSIMGADSTTTGHISLSSDKTPSFFRPADDIKLRLIDSNARTQPQFSAVICDLNRKQLFKTPLTFAMRNSEMSADLTWKIPADTAEGVFFLYVCPADADLSSNSVPLWFFRVFKREIIPSPSYKITKVLKGNTPVYCLDGGMSIEYAVEKSLENLDCGVSHSWYTQAPGSGPKPVYSSLDFVRESIQETIRNYDNLDKNAVYNTAIVGTGVACAPYLSRVMKAPVLPIHFLVSYNSMDELQCLLRNASKQGYAVYAVAGYDPSMKAMGVAWIKFLELPAEYQEFLLRHKTRNVIVLGSTGTIGETLVRKVITPDHPGDSAAPADIFLLYTSSSYTPFGWKKDSAKIFASPQYKTDMDKMKARIAGIDQLALAPEFQRVADWESGISPDQLSQFVRSLKKAVPLDRCVLITAVEDGEAVRHLYEYATYLMLEFYQLNQKQYTKQGEKNRALRGIVMNPYLTSHPFYESRVGDVPYLFWQGRKGADLGTSLNVFAKKAIATYFPQEPVDHPIWINVALNFNLYMTKPLVFADYLRTNKIASEVRISNFKVDEVWAPEDKEESTVEFLAAEMDTRFPRAALKEWDRSLLPLTLDHLKHISSIYPKILAQDL